MYINDVADSVMLYLQHDFRNIIFKIKHKLYIASGSLPQGKTACTPESSVLCTPSMFPFLERDTFKGTLAVVYTVFWCTLMLNKLRNTRIAQVL